MYFFFVELFFCVNVQCSVIFIFLHISAPLLLLSRLTAGSTDHTRKLSTGVNSVVLNPVNIVVNNVVMMTFFELFLLRKISEFPRGTHNLQIAGETCCTYCCSGLFEQHCTFRADEPTGVNNAVQKYIISRMIAILFYVVSTDLEKVVGTAGIMLDISIVSYHVEYIYIFFLSRFT